MASAFTVPALLTDVCCWNCFSSEVVEKKNQPSANAHIAPAEINDRTVKERILKTLPASMDSIKAKSYVTIKFEAAQLNC